MERSVGSTGGGDLMIARRHVVEIDRLVLTDLGITPERAGHLRETVAVELQRRLDVEGLPAKVTGGEVARLKAARIELAGPHSDARLADSIAKNVARALRGME